MNILLRDKVAMVTGASRGIGRAIALDMARAGADIILASRKQDELEKVADEIRAIGRRALPVAAHIGKMPDIVNLVNKAIKSFKRIDILVNNAAANPTMDPAIFASERAWDTIMNLNLKGLFFLSQAVAQIMKDTGTGVIINIASVSGILAHTTLPVYAISKAGVIHATKIMAADWAQYGIRVNTISPGQVKTHLSQALWSNPEIYAMMLERTPLKRMAEPAEIASAAVFLASDCASYITGQNFLIDGGISLI
ncbi:MAG: glucose 1-dehydrogenase [Dehalococcoidia bacterium]